MINGLTEIRFLIVPLRKLNFEKPLINPHHYTRYRCEQKLKSFIIDLSQHQDKRFILNNFT